MARRPVLAAVLGGTVIMALLASARSLPPAPTLHGRVRDAFSPVTGARIRLKGKAAFGLSDCDGRFSLPVAVPDRSARVTAAREGYRIAGAPAVPGMILRLVPLPGVDCEEYRWVDPAPDPARVGNCGNCHGEI